MAARGHPELNHSRVPAGRVSVTALWGRLSPKGLSCFWGTKRRWWKCLKQCDLRGFPARRTEGSYTAGREDLGSYTEQDNP